MSAKSKSAAAEVKAPAYKKTRSYYQVRFWRAKARTLQQGWEWVLAKSPSAASMRLKLTYRQDVLEIGLVEELSEAQYLSMGGVL